MNQKKKLKNRIREFYYIFIGRTIYKLKTFFECYFEKIVNTISSVKNGYSYRDVWDFENWFINTIPQVIEDVKKYSPRIVPLLENGDIDDDINHRWRGGEYKQWHDILDNIIIEFKNAKKFEKMSIDGQESSTVLPEVYQEYDRKSIEHVRNGLKLLSKYFGYFGW